MLGPRVADSSPALSDSMVWLSTVCMHEKQTHTKQAHRCCSSAH